MKEKHNMACFFGGILFTAFVLFLGIKLKKLKLEYGDFKEDKSGKGTPTQPGNTKQK